MKLRTSLAFAALAALPACGTDSTGPQACSPYELRQLSVSGDTVALHTGLRYIDTQVGAGATADFCDTVSIQYTGRLLDGTQFDTGSFGFVPGLGGLIAGFEQGVVGMKVGGTRRLIIPPSLGYGNQQSGPIPANSTLIFDIELLEVVDN